MSATVQETTPPAIMDEMPPAITLRLRPTINLTADQLLEISSLNDDLRLELTAKGELIVMAPAGGRSSAGNARITSQLTVWADEQTSESPSTPPADSTFPTAPSSPRTPRGLLARVGRDSLPSNKRRSYHSAQTSSLSCCHRAID